MKSVHTKEKKLAEAIEITHSKTKVVAPWLHDCVSFTLSCRQLMKLNELQITSVNKQHFRPITRLRVS